jgi:putative FmdB family regulatory protein
MPMYEYRCSRCGKTFEKLRKMQDADREVKCPHCEAEEVERLVSAFATGGGCGPGGGSRFT